MKNTAETADAGSHDPASAVQPVEKPSLSACILGLFDEDAQKTMGRMIGISENAVREDLGMPEVYSYSKKHAEEQINDKDHDHRLSRGYFDLWRGVHDFALSGGRKAITGKDVDKGMRHAAGKVADYHEDTFTENEVDPMVGMLNKPGNAKAKKGFAAALKKYLKAAHKVADWGE